MDLYQQLRCLDDMELIVPKFSFECTICFENIEPDQKSGIQLKECLHTFCRECITNYISMSTDLEIQCPYANMYRCESVIQHREIRALVSKEVYEKHIARSVDRANVGPNKFHCKTPDCSGWWVCEDIVHLYKCPVCSITNCTDCEAVHEGFECQVYQDQKNFDNLDDHISTEAVYKLIQEKHALKCPKCGIAIVKISGCDGVQCSSCKVHICWATRGPRWGPAGEGDTSGGCRCGVNGNKCHPSCSNCH